MFKSKVDVFLKITIFLSSLFYDIFFLNPSSPIACNLNKTLFFYTLVKILGFSYGFTFLLCSFARDLNIYFPSFILV